VRNGECELAHNWLAMSRSRQNSNCVAWIVDVCDPVLRSRSRIL
jgi:hypothetical protein